MSDSTDATVEAVARSIARENGDDFDNIHRDKRHWLETGGRIGNVFREVGAPMQSDFRDMARAAISAHLDALKAQGMVVVPAHRFMTWAEAQKEQAE